MALADRKSLGQCTNEGERLRKSIPTLAEITNVFASEEGVAVQYLLVGDILTIPTCPTCNRYCLQKADT
jgi:hypothetical protein